MVEFTVAEVSEQLNTSTQNTYKKLDFLISKGMAYKNEHGKTFIYENGLNYLRETTRKNMVARNEDKPLNINENAHTIVVATLQEQVDRMSNEVEYWKKLYEKKDTEYTEFVNKSTLMLDVAKKESEVAKEDYEQSLQRNAELIKENAKKDEEIYNLQNSKKWFQFWK